MSEKHYKIVFSGDLAFDTDEVQARERLASRCKYKPEAIKKLLSGGKIVIKTGLDMSNANRYKKLFDEIGLLCDIVDEAPPPPASEDLAETAVLKIAKPIGRTCPKCFSKQQTTDICQHCGVIFSRYDVVQARREAPNEDDLEEESSEDPYFIQHPEQLFIAKAFGVILLILLLNNLLHNLIPMFVLFFPIGFLIYIRLEAAANDESPTELLAQHITFMPVMYSKEERKQQYLPLVTYSLILANILIFYLFEMQVSPELISDYLIFLPLQPNLFSVPLSAVTSLFLHAGNGHLWGNMLFLWAVGTVVERRIGSTRFTLFYIATGVTANLVFLLVSKIAGTPPHILGASGAIAGIMGLFAVRCYFKSMVFPLPILGIFSLFLPLSLKVRLNSLVIIGLFFLADLNGGVQQLTGESSSNIGHWAHIGGMLSGILLAAAFKLNREAFTERHIEIGNQAVNSRIGSGINNGEESLRLLLKTDPDNTEARLLLAQLRSKYAPTDEGEELYRQVIPQLVSKNPDEAMLTFCEFHKTYVKGLDPQTMYRLANSFHRCGNYEMATRCLEDICNNEQTPATVLEKALFQCARTLETMGLPEAAQHYYRSCFEKFPDSPLGSKAKMRLAEQSS